MASEDETQRIHKRISDLSIGLIATSLGLIILTCAMCCVNLDDIFDELSRIF